MFLQPFPILPLVVSAVDRWRVRSHLNDFANFYHAHGSKLQFPALALELFCLGSDEQFAVFVHRNGGTLPNQKRKREFAALKDEELIELEEIVRDAFDVFDLALGANLHSESEK